MRILVAEDDAILADAVLHSLRQSGYAVDWVKNGVEADCALAAHACAASTRAPTTSSPSHSISPSWKRACARSRAAACPAVRRFCAMVL